MPELPRQMRDEPGGPWLVLLIDPEKTIAQDQYFGLRPIVVRRAGVRLDHLKARQALRFERALDLRHPQHFDQIAEAPDGDRAQGIRAITPIDGVCIEHPARTAAAATRAPSGDQWLSCIR